MLLKYRPYIKIDMMGVSPVALLLSSHLISILQAKQIYPRLQGGSKSSLRKLWFLPPKKPQSSLRFSASKGASPPRDHTVAGWKPFLWGSLGMKHFRKRCCIEAGGFLCVAFPGRRVQQWFGHWFNHCYSLTGGEMMETINVSQRWKFIHASALIIQVCRVNPRGFLVYCLLRSTLDPRWLEVASLQGSWAPLGTGHWSTLASFTTAVEIAIIAIYFQCMCPLRAMMCMTSERIIWRLVSARGARCPSSPLATSAGLLEC